MYIIYLKFGPNRAQASQWMSGHVQWLQQGIDDGAFLMAGSLENSQGGVVLAANLDQVEIKRRIETDPFVIHGVVSVELHTITPSRMAQGIATLIDGARSLSVNS